MSASVSGTPYAGAAPPKPELLELDDDVDPPPPAPEEDDEDDETESLPPDPPPPPVSLPPQPAMSATVGIAIAERPRSIAAAVRGNVPSARRNLAPQWGHSGSLPFT